MGFIFRLLWRILRSGSQPEERRRVSRRTRGYGARARTRTFRPGETISGKAYVIDGDTISVSGQRIRLSALDAPELDQVAQHQDGYWFEQGQHVKSALIREIGGKPVSVYVEGYDRYNRVLGIVIHDGMDVGEWLVLNGYAIAAYGERYRSAERDAQRAQRGMWGHAEHYDPRAWRRYGGRNAAS